MRMIDPFFRHAFITFGSKMENKKDNMEKHIIIDSYNIPFLSFETLNQTR